MISSIARLASMQYKNSNPIYRATQEMERRAEEEKKLLAEHDALAQQYQGTEFEGYFSNPWRSLVDTFKSGNLYQGRQRKNAIQQMMASDSDAIKKVTDLEYASPLSTVKHQAEAGLNSDLVGISPQMPSESPSEAGRESLFPSRVGDFSSVAQALLSITATAMSIPEGLQGLASGALQNAMDIEDLVEGHLGDFPELVPSEGNVVENLLKSSVLTGERLPKLAQSLFPQSKRLQKQFESNFRQKYNTAGGKLARAENARSLLEMANDPMFDDEYRGCLREMARISMKNQLAHLRIDTKYKEMEEKLQNEKGDTMYENMEKELEATGDVYDTQKVLNSASRTHARLEQTIDNNTNGEEVGKAITAENIADRKQAELNAADMDAIKEFETYLDSLNGTPSEAGKAAKEKGFFVSWQDYRKYKRARRRHERGSSGVGIGTTIVKSLLK